MTNTTQNTKRQVWFKTETTGRKVAYYWSGRACRAIRMSLSEAEMLVATGQSVDIGGHPLARRES